MAPRPGRAAGRDRAEWEVAGNRCGDRAVVHGAGAARWSRLLQLSKVGVYLCIEQSSKIQVSEQECIQIVHKYILTNLDIV